MTKTTTIVGLLTALILGTAGTARAQVSPAPLTQGFVSINAGVQRQAGRDFSTGATYPKYGEIAFFDAVHNIHNGGLFDVNGGMRVTPRIGVGAGFSSFTAKKGDAIVNSSVPNIIIINQPRAETVAIEDLKHSERAFYFQAVFIMPITNKIDVSLGVGPTFIKANQDLVSNIDIPSGQIVVPVVETQSKTAVGLMIGFDGTYLFTPRIGAGLFVRYAGATVDLPSVSALKVGGVQAGLGLRVRF